MSMNAQLPSAPSLRRLNLEWFCYGKISHISSRNSVRMYRFDFTFIGFGRIKN